VKVQCDLCKEIVVADFAVVGDGSIELSCPTCHGRFAVAATRARRVTGDQVVHGESRRARRASMPASHEPSMTCPKCGEVQRPGPACRQCGLLAERMADFARDEAAEVPASLLAEWRAVLDRWREPDLHERFAQQVAATGSYSWAARRYRDELRVRGDDAVAAEQIARLARMAEATLLASAAARPARAATPYRSVIIVVLLATLAVGIVVAYHFMSRDDAAPGRSTPAVPVAPAPAR
jgi:ribosomal protein L32